MKLWKKLKFMIMGSRAEEGAAKKQTTGQESVESVDHMNVKNAGENSASTQMKNSKKFALIATLMEESHLQRDTLQRWEQYFAEEDIGHIVLTIHRDKESIIIGGILRIDLMKVNGKTQAQLHIVAPKCINVARIKHKDLKK